MISGRKTLIIKRGMRDKRLSDTKITYQIDVKAFFFFLTQDFNLLIYFILESKRTTCISQKLREMKTKKLLIRPMDKL